MEAEGALNESVRVLQAHVRGFLTRRRLRNVREDYLALVREIEGEESHLHWETNVFSIPRFIREKKVQQKLVQQHVNPDSKDTSPVQVPLISEQKVNPLPDAWRKDHEYLQHTDPGESLTIKDMEANSMLEIIPAKSKSLLFTNPKSPVAGFDSEKKCLEHTKQEEDAEQGDSEKGCLKIYPVREREPTVKQRGSEFAAHNGQSQQSLEWSTDSWIWKGKVLDEGIPFENLSELQRHRSHLAMEILWVQQAIASRKNIHLAKLAAHHITVWCIFLTVSNG
ncbi:hypothetical protein XENTR_v10005943 [Xenopus tropicalis]|nr:hypothetical protein XENTR_v10005943 [Xenopus tropicalis]